MDNLGVIMDNMDTLPPVIDRLTLVIERKCMDAGLSLPVIAARSGMDERTLRDRMVDGGSFAFTELVAVAMVLGCAVADLFIA